jgi:hypothetical protein
MPGADRQASDDVESGHAAPAGPVDGDPSAGSPDGDDWGPEYLFTKEQYEVLCQALTDDYLSSLRSMGEAAWEWLRAEGGEIAVAIAESILLGVAMIHRAPPGSGKTRSIMYAAVALARAGQRVVVAFATRVDCNDFLGGLRALAPDLFERGAVAECFGARTMEEERGRRGRYPVDAGTSIAIVTHAQLGRRRWSRLVSGFFRVIDPTREDADVKFHIIIDEYSLFIAFFRQAIELSHRAVHHQVLDKSHARLAPATDCPKRAGWANCASCSLQGYGGRPRFNVYGHRVLAPPEGVDVGNDGRRAAKPLNPLKVGEAELVTSEPVKVGRTNWAAHVVSCFGTDVVDAGWRRAELVPHARDEDGDDCYPPESNEAILKHIIECVFRPIVTVEYATGPRGERISSADLRCRAESGDAKWDDGVTFPYGTCEVRTLRGMDMAALEMLARVRERRGVGIALVGATSIADDDEIIEAAFPDIRVRDYPQPPRQIEQIAVVAMADSCGLSSLVRADGPLGTIDLEAAGEVLILTDKKRKAMDLFERVKEKHPGCSVVQGRNRHRIIEDDVRTMAANKTIIAYDRSVLAHGVNLLGVRTLVIDCNAFRPLSSFNPGDLTVEQFEHHRARERLALIVQCVGRALRGDASKTAVVILIHADRDIIDAITDSPLIRSGCREPLLMETGDDMGVVIDQSRRFLEAGGGRWPSADPSKATRSKPGRPKLNLAALIYEAVCARRSGVTWRDFSRKFHLDRVDITERLLIRNAYEGIV